MTKDEIMNMPAGRELDRVIAEKIFGYETQEGSNWCKGNNHNRQGIIELLNYSTDMNDAMEIARKFLPNFTLNYLNNELFPIGWHCNINDHHAKGCKTPSQAICRAALLATIGGID